MTNYKWIPYTGPGRMRQWPRDSRALLNPLTELCTTKLGPLTMLSLSLSVACAAIFLSTVCYADQVVLPTSSFDNYTIFEQYWNYLYPWGSDHNGGMLLYVDPQTGLMMSIYRCQDDRQLIGPLPHLTLVLHTHTNLHTRLRSTTFHLQPLSRYPLFLRNSLLKGPNLRRRHF